MPEFIAQHTPAAPRAPRLPNEATRYGASMGRGSAPFDSEYSGLVTLTRVRLDSGGYDSGGAYWGVGDPLYVAGWGGATRYLRAKSRADVARQVSAEMPRATVDEPRAAARENFESFVVGYFEAAEWLWPEPSEDGGGIDRDKVRGWSRVARRAMRADCRDFWRANRADLAVYAEARGWESAGTDFFLTRERHGTGFWDRGLSGLGERLTAACRGFGEYGYPYLHRGWVCL
jgi:hypothetical protein